MCGRSLHNTNQVLSPPIVFITTTQVSVRVCILTALVKYCTTRIPRQALVSLVNTHTSTILCSTSCHGSSVKVMSPSHKTRKPKYICKIQLKQWKITYHGANGDTSECNAWSERPIHFEVTIHCHHYWRVAERERSACEREGNPIIPGLLFRRSYGNRLFG